MMRTKIGAHRGAMAYEPENTLRAFQKAIDLGTYRIELDVRRSKDGEIVLVHDATIDRTTNGTGRVKELSLEELKRLDAGKGETIPTLAETLAFAKEKVKLLVEIKDEGIEEQVAQLAHANGTEQEIIISSFAESVLKNLRESHPDIGTGVFQLTGDPIPVRELFDRFGMAMIIANGESLTAEEVERAHECGVLVRVGFNDKLDFDTIRKSVERLYNIGVDEISSGRPDWIGQVIQLAVSER